MKVFYTYGPNEFFPFQNGWVEVEADSIAEANEIYRSYYPDKIPGMLTCANYYSEYRFYKTKMPEQGNWGGFCHRKLTKNAAEDIDAAVKTLREQMSATLGISSDVLLHGFAGRMNEEGKE